MSAAQNARLQQAKPVTTTTGAVSAAGAGVARSPRMPPVTAIAISLAFAAAAESGTLAADTGQVCLAPLPDQAKQLDHDFEDGHPQRREPHYEFTVEFDEADPVAVPLDGEPLLLPEMPAGIRHRVTIRDRGERIESFFFTFGSRGSKRLCLSYKPWYQTWSLDPPRPKASWCACKWERD